MYEREFSRERFELSGKTQTTEAVKRAELVERNRIEVDRRIQRLENRFSEYYRTIRELAQDVEFTPDGASRGYGNDAYRGGEPTPDKSAVSLEQAKTLLTNTTEQLSQLQQAVLSLTEQVTTVQTQSQAVIANYASRGVYSNKPRRV